MFNQILILDSIPLGEYNTARRLHDDVLLLAAVVDEAPAVVFLRVESAAHFANVMAQCAALAAREPYAPLVHLECHGDPEHVQFADGSSATWAQLKDALTPLNIATRLNLVAVISACHGSALASAVQVTDPAPVWGFIGPNRGLRAHELLAAFLAFYQRLLLSQSAEDAAQALRATAQAGTFMVMSSQRIFDLVVARYQAQFGHPDAIRERAQVLQQAAHAQGIHVPVDAIADLLAAPEWTERFRRIFFMIDRYPEHHERFPVNY